VVTLDVSMPEMDGLSCLARLMRHRPTPVVMVSSLTDRHASATVEALALGAVDFVHKPGGTVSLDLHRAAPDIVDKVRAAALARVRGGGLAARLRAQHVRVPTAGRGGPGPRRGRRRAADLVLIGA
jgi:two-component system chemotaxis response regulator CheB